MWKFNTLIILTRPNRKNEGFEGAHLKEKMSHYQIYVSLHSHKWKCDHIVLPFGLQTIFIPLEC